MPARPRSRPGVPPTGEAYTYPARAMTQRPTVPEESTCRGRGKAAGDGAAMPFYPTVADGRVSEAAKT
jgi:hypothetical protein